MATDQTTKNEVEARQGTRKPNLIYVLVASLALIIVVFGVVWFATSH